MLPLNFLIGDTEYNSIIQYLGSIRLNIEFTFEKNPETMFSTPLNGYKNSRGGKACIIIVFSGAIKKYRRSFCDYLAFQSINAFDLEELSLA